MTFAELDSSVKAQAVGALENQLFGSEDKSRGWFHACQRAVENNDHPTLAKWLDPTVPNIQRWINIFPEALMMRLHLLCAVDLVLARGDVAPPPHLGDLQNQLTETRTKANVKAGFIEDLKEELLSKKNRPAKLSETISVVLIGKNGCGVARSLVLDLLVIQGQRSSDFYRSPKLAFVDRDASFLLAETEAGKVVTKELTRWESLGIYDVRWHLQGSRHPLPRDLEGSSMGGALTLGALTLLSKELPPSRWWERIGRRVTAFLDR